jgi:hypothetical protein
VPQILTRAETRKTFRLSSEISDSYNSHSGGVATAFIELTGTLMEAGQDTDLATILCSTFLGDRELNWASA